MRFLTLTSIATLLILVLVSCQSTATPPPFECTDDIGCVSLGPDDPIKIAALHIDNDANEFVRMLELAILERENTLLGHPIAVEVFETLCSPEGGRNAAAQVATQSEFVAIHGTTCSGAAIEAAPIIAEAGLVMISGSNTAPELTSIDAQTPAANWHPGYFRTAPNDVYQGHVAATFAYEELGLRRAATIGDGLAYAVGLAQSFQNSFTALGGEIVYTGTIDRNDRDMAPIVAGVADTQPDIVFLSFQALGGDELVVREATNAPEMQDVTLMGGESLFDTAFTTSAGDAAIGMYLIGPTIPTNEATRAVVEAFEAEYDTELVTSLYLHNYDAANLLLDAIEQVAIQTEDGNLHIGRQALRDALYATENYPGLTGSLTCNQFGDCGVPNYIIAQLEDPAAGVEGLLENVVYRTGN